ncbi:hypothetical protein R1sor_015870 [Riccia sorocarpa]|uniref:CCHC-type domain-containing protein n=1 Tax=Riccia sorocarpa TaxID=122646 RepID=A0ABD3HHL0_9MARC
MAEGRVSRVMSAMEAMEVELRESGDTDTGDACGVGFGRKKEDPKRKGQVLLSVLSRDNRLADQGQEAGKKDTEPNISTTLQEKGRPEKAAESSFQAWARFRAADQGLNVMRENRGAGERVEDEVAGSQKEEEWGEGITWAMLDAELSTMPTADVGSHEEMDEIRLIDLDVGKAASKLGRFCKTAIVLQTLESAPSRDRVVGWIRDMIVRRRGISVSQVQVMSRREFLLVFKRAEDKDEVMKRPPEFLDGKLVRFFEWGDRHSKKLSINTKAAWVELRNIPPFLEDQVAGMLAALGSVAYQTIDKQEMLKYANVRGCVLVDVSQELPKKIGLTTPWKKTYIQQVVYTKLPDHCFICHLKGHYARNCPKKVTTNMRPAPPQGTALGDPQVNTEIPSNGGVETVMTVLEPDTEGFERVSTRSRTKTEGGEGRGEVPTLSLKRTGSCQLGLSGEAKGSKQKALIEEEGESGDAQSVSTENKQQKKPNWKLSGVAERISNEEVSSESGGRRSRTRDTQKISGQEAESSRKGGECSTNPWGILDLYQEGQAEVIREAGERKKKESPSTTKGERKERNRPSIQKKEVSAQLFQSLEKFCQQGGGINNVGGSTSLLSSPVGKGEDGSEDEAHSDAAEMNVDEEIVADSPNIEEEGAGKSSACVLYSLGGREVVVADLVKQKEEGGTESDIQGLGVEHLGRKWDPHEAEDEANPFKSIFSLVDSKPNGAELGQEVVFGEQDQLLSQLGRGPKKKGGSGLRSKVGKKGKDLVPGEIKKSAEKRRALSSMDVNGCRQSDSRSCSASLEEDPHRARKLRNDGLSQVRQVLRNLSDTVRRAGALQELKTESWATMRWLQNIRKKGTVVYDKPRGSRGGTTLILHEDIKVQESGVEGNGRSAWAKVELPEDSRGPSAVLRGSEERIWRQITLENGLVDGFFCAASTEGEIRERVKEAWEGETVTVRDERRRWARGWARVKSVLREVRRQREQDRRKEGDLEQEVIWRRQQITEESTEAELDMLATIEGKLRERELQEARMWRLRSRERWLSEDEAPSRYFFAKLCAKWARESMEALQQVCRRGDHT